MTVHRQGHGVRGADPEVLETRDQAFLFKGGTPQVLRKIIEPGEGRSQAQLLNHGPGGARVILLKFCQCILSDPYILFGLAFVK